MIGRTEVDIADADAVARTVAEAQPAMVVNAAAYTKVDRAETEPDAAFRANATGPGMLAAACAAAGIPLLHISTDYVFDGTKPTAYVEDDPIAPLGVYGESKAEGEAAVRRLLDDHVILRTSWVYGVYGANFLKTVLRLARERDELRIVADQRGCPTGTADLAEAILAIAPLLVQREPVWGTYHFAGQGATTWQGFASEIVDAQAVVTNRHPAVVPISTAEYPTAARRPANGELNSSRFAATFGIKAKDWRERTRQVTAALLS
jgi:dTDP-4-dehydrorhamnose reductase